MRMSIKMAVATAGFSLVGCTAISVQPIADAASLEHVLKITLKLFEEIFYPFLKRGLPITASAQKFIPTLSQKSVSSW